MDSTPKDTRLGARGFGQPSTPRAQKQALSPPLLRDGALPCSVASLLLPSLAYPGGGQAEAREPQDGGCKAFLVQSSTHTGRWCSQTDTGMQIDTCVPQLTAHCSPTPSKMPQDQLLAWARQGDRAHSEVLHANCCRAIPGDLHLALPWAQLLLCCSLCPPALPTGILVPKDLAPRTRNPDGPLLDTSA